MSIENVKITFEYGGKRYESVACESGSTCKGCGFFASEGANHFHGVCQSGLCANQANPHVIFKEAKTND